MKVPNNLQIASSAQLNMNESSQGKIMKLFRIIQWACLEVGMEVQTVIRISPSEIVPDGGEL